VSCLVTALFYDSSDTERAVEALIARGIPPGDLSLMVSRSTARKYFTPERSSSEHSDEETKGPLAKLAENLIIVASGGGVILATGPLWTALSARGTHPKIGSVSAGLCSLGVTDEEAAFYEHTIRSSDALLLGVNATERPDCIKAFLRWFDTAHARDSLAETA
jgi:hypothetical protein